MGSRGANEPVRIYATGACNVDKAILELKDSNPSEAIDTANILIEFESGSTATIQVRSFVYGVQPASVGGGGGGGGGVIGCTIIEMNKKTMFSPLLQFFGVTNPGWERLSAYLS